MLKELLDFSLPPKPLNDDNCTNNFLFCMVQIREIPLNIFHNFKFHGVDNLSFLINLTHYRLFLFV
jgi:hypothetical protein